MPDAKLCLSMVLQRLIDVEDLKLLQSSPYKLEHVELKNEMCRYKSPGYVALVDAVLWCCRPRSLTLALYHPTDKVHVVEVRFICFYVGENENYLLGDVLFHFHCTSAKVK